MALLSPGADDHSAPAFVGMPLQRGHMDKFVRISRLIAHILRGLSTIVFIFPKLNTAQRNMRIKQWSIKLAGLFGIQVRTYGLSQPEALAGSMLLANHISWFDIFALNTALVSRFVAKSEIEQWPVIGKLCIGAGTIFICREKRHDTLRVNEDICKILAQGETVSFFPEGTTTDGTYLRPFRPSLLQAAVDSQAMVQPVYLRYLDAFGRPSTRAAYIDDVTLGQTISSMLCGRGEVVELHFLEPVHSAGLDRRTLSSLVEDRLRAHHNQLNPQSPDIAAAPVPETALQNLG